jgi:hypothetical protein
MKMSLRSRDCRCLTEESRRIFPRSVHRLYQTSLCSFELFIQRSLFDLRFSSLVNYLEVSHVLSLAGALLNVAK